MSATPTSSSIVVALAVAQAEPHAVGHAEEVEREIEFGSADAGGAPSFGLGRGEVAVGGRDARDRLAEVAGDRHEPAGHVRLVVGMRPHGDDRAEVGDRGRGCR